MTRGAQIREVTDRASLDLKAISDLMAEVGMRPRDPVQMQRALEHSSDVVVAESDDLTLLGFGRLVSDRVYYGTVWDVAVRLSHQRRGIGTDIVRQLLGCAARRRLSMLDLSTIKSNRAFYENLGFKFQDDVHAMVWENTR